MRERILKSVHGIGKFLPPAIGLAVITAILSLAVPTTIPQPSQQQVAVAIATAPAQNTTPAQPEKISANPWKEGLIAWTKDDAQLAASLFTQRVQQLQEHPDKKDKTGTQTSAAAFWAWRALMETGEPAEANIYLHLAADAGPNFYGMLARNQLKRRLPRMDYPTPDLKVGGNYVIDEALIYALIKQESGFRQASLSPAGAQGLMQLMPSTASLMKKKLGATEPHNNVMLGQHYVKHLLDNPLVEQNLVYMLAAYNAGAGRLQNWQDSIDFKNDPLLFIEKIPFTETRNFVMQVLANYWIYSDILGTPKQGISALVNGKWPGYAKRTPSNLNEG
jgi:soluble lytic murein transglycosylase-like protein